MKQVVIAGMLLVASMAAEAACQYIWVQYPGQLGQWVYVCD
jgi:hypothetical protein